MHVPTFRSAAKQDVDAVEESHGFCHGKQARAHVAVASNAANAVFPALSILSTAFAFINKFSKLSAALVMVNLVRRQTGHDIVAMWQQSTYQAHGQGGQRSGDEPGARRIVRRCRQSLSVSHCSRCIDFATRYMLLAGSPGGIDSPAT